MSRKIKVSIRMKLTAVFLLTTLIVFVVNIYMFGGINRMIAKIDNIYNSNAELTSLQASLSRVRGSMLDYLNTKNSEAMGNYYASEQEYRERIEKLNDTAYENSTGIMEKNIRSMSQEYLDVTADAVEAKRGRNVEKYNQLYEQSEEIFEYINTYIYSLNNLQFQSNTTHYEELLAALQYSETINMVIMILVGVLNILLIVLLTSSITEPLKKLANSANEVAGGNLELELVAKDNGDEVSVLTTAFYQMVKSLKLYIERLRESMEKENELREREILMESHLTDAKLKYLQAQVNPHFLFNTLNAGAQLAMMEGAERTYSYIQNVADFYRYNIKKDNDIVTLGDEIRLVDSYIYILNVRFSGDIHYYKDIDESLLGLQVPIMILQPIVENCVNHGLRNVSWEKEIRLTVSKERDLICISVCDNGVGITSDKIREILEDRTVSTDVETDSNGIGLNNVIHRLRLFYHIDNVMEITSNGENMGTEIALLIPEEERV